MLVHNAKARSSIPSVYLFVLVSFFFFALALVLSQAFNSGIGTAEASTFLVYRSEHNHFSISYPSNWQIGAGNEEAGVTTIASIVTRNTQEGGLIDPRSYRTTSTPAMDNFSKIDVLSYDVAPGTSARDFLFARSNAGIVGEATTLSVDGVEAIRLDVDMAQALQNHSFSKTYTNIYLTKGEKGYIIAGFAAPEVLEKIIQSFKAW